MEKFLKRKDQWLILLLGGLILAVAAMPGGNKSSQKSTVQTVSQEETANTQSGDSSVEALEKRLSELLSQVQGLGKTKVMITLEESGERAVAFDSQNTSRSVKESSGTSTQEEDSSQSTVYEKEAGGGEPPYVTKETAPKIRGVLVAAQGGDDPENVRNITEAVMALFHIEAHKIKVMKMK